MANSIRWALLLEYDGTEFVGWQRQAQGVSIQHVLEQAAAALAGEPVAAVAAGRTDSGVHAAGQVAHIDLARAIAPDRLVQALNFHMRPHAVCVLQAAIVAADWSARFSATGRRYHYTILNRPAHPTLLAGRVWHVRAPLDHNAMAEAARALLGRHDFTSFRAAACQANSPLRTLDRLDITRAGELIHFDVAARSFLHHQVRNMVGTLKLVGEGNWPPSRVATALAARDRAQAGPTAPAEGLVLQEVTYDPPVFTAASPRLPDRGDIQRNP
jgi:tRNA pseudouridine38-40 synthase